MRNDRETLLRIAAKRRQRFEPNGRPRIELTREHVEGSTDTAMRLARASKQPRRAEDRDHLAVCI